MAFYLLLAGGWHTILLYGALVDPPVKFPQQKVGPKKA